MTTITVPRNSARLWAPMLTHSPGVGAHLIRFRVEIIAGIAAALALQIARGTGLL